LREGRHIRKTRIFKVLVVALFLLSSILPANVGETTWLRRRDGPVIGRIWVDTSRWENRVVEISPARTIPAVTERRWVETAPALPALGVWRTEVVSPGRWEDTILPPIIETSLVRVADAVPAVYEIREEVTPERTEWRFVPPLTMGQLIQVAPALPGRFVERLLPSQGGSWQNVWIPPVVEVRPVWFPAEPARFEWHTVEVDPGRWESTWIPPVTDTRWVETSPARPAQPAQWGWQTIEVSPGRWGGFWGWEEDEFGNMRIIWVPQWIPPVTDTRWVELSPAVPEQPAQGFWQTIELVPGRTEWRWIPPLTMGQWVQVAPALPGRYENRLVEVSPGRWETVWVPTPTQMRLVQVAPEIPAQYETRTIVVTPARTTPAVTERRWVQTSPAVAARPAQGGWQDVVLIPARRETREVRKSSWREAVYGFTAAQMPTHHQLPTFVLGEGGWTVITPGVWETRVHETRVLVPAVTERRWVETSPAVAARAAQGEWRDVVVTPALHIPAVTTTQVVRVAEAIPARYELRPVHVDAVTERVWVDATPARYEWHETEVDPGRWESTWIPSVTTTQTVRVAEAIPARYEQQTTEVVPARLVSAWIPPILAHSWVETSPAMPAQGEWRDVVVTPAIFIPPVTEVRSVWVPSGHYESLQGTITVERDREYVLTRLWRPRDKTHDMTLTLTYSLNRTVTGVRAVHVLNRYQGMGQMLVHPQILSGGPGRVLLNFNYTNPGQANSTLDIWLDFAGGETLKIFMEIPVNGIVVTQRRDQGPLVLNRAAARVGTVTIP